MRDCDQQKNCLSLYECGRFLLSMSLEDAMLIEQSREYREFARMVSYMEQARWTRFAKFYDSEQDGLIERHSLDVEQSDNANVKNVSLTNGSKPQCRQLSKETRLSSFIQHEAADDLILKIFDFLGCVDLVSTSTTCSRLSALVIRNAKGRTNDLARERQLENVLQLLRAQEQMEGIGTGQYDKFVRIPTLLLSRRVIITNSGDPDYNGVYCCTDTNGNGFVFTKPRQPRIRVPQVDTGSPSISSHEHAPGGDSPLETEVALPGQLLRCIIAKRFSNEVSNLS